MQVLYITDVVNRPEYIPRNPTSENLPNVFDVRFPEVYSPRYFYDITITTPAVLQVQPYLHRIIIGVPEETVAGKMQKLIRNTFANYQL